MKKSKLTNTTTIDATGKRIIPNLYTEKDGDFMLGDILDANSIMSIINQKVGGITDGAPESLDSLQEVSQVIAQLNETVASLQEETSKLKEEVSPVSKHAPTTNKALANVGDIAIGYIQYDYEDCDSGVWFVDPADYDWYKLEYNVNNTEYFVEEIGSIYFALGIVVVPASHTQDGSVKIVSLKYMDYEHPEGSDNPVEMTWGALPADLQNWQNITQSKMLRYTPGTTTTQIGTTNQANLPTNYGTRIAKNNPDDLNTHWGYIFSLIPSPYNNSGEFNTMYDTADQVLAYKNGKQNTQLIKNSTNWNIGDQVTNVTYDVQMDEYDNEILVADDPDMYTAAFSCLNYTPTCYREEIDGNSVVQVEKKPFDLSYICNGKFKAGEWYLPSVTELSYLMARLSEINNSRNKLELNPIQEVYLYTSNAESSDVVWNVAFRAYMAICCRREISSYCSVLAFASY